MTGRLVALFFGIAALGPATASAQGISKAECAKLHGDSQVQRKKGALIEARESLASCARAECPAVVQKDCVQWAAELDATIPSVVFHVHGDAGDIIDVDIHVDGKPLLNRLEGKAVPLDPGPHTFTLTVNGEPPQEKKVLLTEGERGRVIDVSFAHGATTTPATPPPVPPPDETPKHRPVPTIVWALGAGAVVAIGSFAFFGLRGTSKESDLDACAPFCSSSDVSSARTSFVIADVSLAAGVILAGAAGYFFFTRPAENVAVSPFGVVGRF